MPYAVLVKCQKVYFLSILVSEIRENHFWGEKERGGEGGGKKTRRRKQERREVVRREGGRVDWGRREERRKGEEREERKGTLGTDSPNLRL